MAFRSSIVLVLYAIHASAAKTTLSPELTNLLPTCAHTCFTSFLDFNFALTKCGINPTLDCLCTTKSTSEYTVGEGAVQCVLSTAACTEKGAPDAAAFKAYTMCDGKKGSLPNTHATLTATLVIDSSTVGSARTTSTSNFSASTTITAITTDAASPSTLITTTQRSPPSTTSLLPATSTSVTSQGTAETPIAATSAPLLTKNQTIGVSVGSSIGALAILGLIIFACLRRRKYQRSRDSDMLPFQLDPSNDLNYGHGFNSHMEKKIKGPGGTSNGLATKVAPKIPMRIDTQSPNMFSRKSLKPGMIGVAISPETKSRRASRLLPEKPTLTLTVPNGEKPKAGLYAAGGFGASAISRQSTATQFEEDFDSADTAVAADDSWGRGSNDLLHPPPQQKASAKISEPVPPVPAFMIPGRVQTAIALPIASEFMVKPLNLARGPIGSFSQPRKPDDYPSRAAQSQAAAVRQPLQVIVPPQPQTQSSPPRPTTSSSSIYSNTSIAGSDAGVLPPVLPRNARRSYKPSGPYDKTGHQSNGSLTSFETVDSVIIPLTNVTVQPQITAQVSKPISSSKPSLSSTTTQKPILAPINTNTSTTSSAPSLSKTKSLRRQTATTLDLSPVAESPASQSSPRSGKSPVSYPKIPARGRLPENTIRMVPPPAQPNFNSVFHSGRYAHQDSGFGNGIYGGSKDGQVSPMVASPTPIDNSTAISPATEAKMKPWRVAEIRAQRERESASRLEEPMSAVEPMSAMEIKIGMLTPAFETQRINGNGNGNGSGNGGEKLQPFLAGTGRIWPEQGQNQSQTQQYGNGYQQQQQQQQQRRPQQQQERYLAPSAHFNPSIPQSQSQNQQVYHNPPQQQYKTPLQQQLQSSYQAYNPPQSQNQTRSQTTPQAQQQTQGGRSLTLSPNLRNGTSIGSHTRSSSVSSTASSLLAKRRGEQKGKALALNLSQGSKPSSNPNRGQEKEKWRVLNPSEKEQAKSGAWKPKIGSVERGNDGGVYLGMRGEVGSNGGLGSGLLGTGGLPRTPGWVPKLTPTRRGDELFLSVA